MFTLKISTANEAFGDDMWDCTLEVERILRRIADQVHQGTTKSTVVDANGNTVGKWELK